MPPSAHPYATLGPDLVVEAVERLGHVCDGRVLALNSYENRVYQVGREDGPPLVAKFYRPGRWSTPAILEEHEFALELARAEVPVVAPLVQDGRTLFELGAFRYALYPRQGGRWPELATREERQWMGRFLARIHAVGRTRPFRHRARLDWQVLGTQTARFLLDEGWIPAHLEVAYRSVVEDALALIEQRFDAAAPLRQMRLHGDCHPGNVLWTDAGPHFVDFDDARNGPAIQDLWMLLSGDTPAMARQLDHVLEGYEQFADFDTKSLHLVEALRTLRLIHYAGWIAKRWSDPAFPAAFGWFDTPRYWQDQILALREQIALMDESPLVQQF